MMINLLTVKPATHKAILYADCCDRRKSPGVPVQRLRFSPVAAISPISDMSDIGD